jgi:DNA ligase-4
MLVWDPVSERNLPFGTLKTAALGLYHQSIICLSAYDTSQTNQRRSTIPDHAVCVHCSRFYSNAHFNLVKVFDLLYLNGVSLHQKSLKFRKRNLRACIKEIPGRIEFTAEFEGKTAKDVRQKMDEVMASRGEGLVIKHPDSEYILNGRNKDWIKVKPEYMVNQSRHPISFTLTVLLGQYGRDRGRVSSR